MSFDQPHLYELARRLHVALGSSEELYRTINDPDEQLEDGWGVTISRPSPDITTPWRSACFKEDQAAFSEASEVGERRPQTWWFSYVDPDWEAQLAQVIRDSGVDISDGWNK